MMSIYKYEEAIVSKMREITGDDRVIITPSENIINVIPRIAKDELKLPLIHMIRTNCSIYPKNQHGMKHNGLLNDDVPMFYQGPQNAGDGRIHRMNMIPIQFSHTFEVWSKTREENDEMIRELIWFFHTQPTFEVDIPYGVNIHHTFNLELGNEIIDNSEVISHKDIGEIFLQAIITTCRDAYLWKSMSHNPSCIHIKTELKDNISGHVINSPDYNIFTQEEKRNEVK